MLLRSIVAAVLVAVSFANVGVTAQDDRRPSSSGRARTKLGMLGTGNPGANPDRSGPATVVLVDGVPYLVDFGGGVVRQWTTAVRKHQLGATTFRAAAVQLRTAFLTHLHSDHTIGYADLILTPWTQRRAEGGAPGFRPLSVFGPKGLRAMTDHILAAYSEDIRLRVGPNGERPGGIPPVVNVMEIDAGTIYKDERVTVTAFLVPHGSWPQAFGFRFATPDKTIVISGDTSYAPVLAEQCNGCDVLVHENGIVGDGGAYFKAYHTSAEELAKVANAAKPKLLILSHQPQVNEEGVRVIRARYPGRVVVANDLDVFD